MSIYYKDCLNSFINIIDLIISEKVKTWIIIII